MFSNKCVPSELGDLLRLLVQYHDPELCSLLDSTKVTPDLYFNDWFRILYIKSQASDVTIIIWNIPCKLSDILVILFTSFVMVINAKDELFKLSPIKDKMLELLASLPEQLQDSDIDDLNYVVSNYYANSTPRSIGAYCESLSKQFLACKNSESTTDANPSTLPVLLHKDESKPTVDENYNTNGLYTLKFNEKLELSAHLCLPIIPIEIFLTKKENCPLVPGYFLVDCRPVRQYNSGHLVQAFHLDCSLMLSEPSEFSNTVKALLDIQKQMGAAESNNQCKHLCFIGSGFDKHDRYVNMVVASFLQRGQKNVSIVHGGFGAIHRYLSMDHNLFEKLVVDHNPKVCKTCKSEELAANSTIQPALPPLWSPIKSCVPPGALPSKNLSKTSINSSKPSSDSGKTTTTNVSTSTNSASKMSNNLPKMTASINLSQTINSFKNPLSLNNPNSLASAFTKLTSSQATANNLAVASSMFDKFTLFAVSKSKEFKEKIVDSLNNPVTYSSNFSADRHVNQNDNLGPKYKGAASSPELLLQAKITTDSNTSNNLLKHSIQQQSPKQTLNDSNSLELEQKETEVIIENNQIKQEVNSQQKHNSLQNDQHEGHSKINSLNCNNETKTQDIQLKQHNQQQADCSTTGGDNKIQKDDEDDNDDEKKHSDTKAT